jgi:hypothetical protein
MFGRLWRKQRGCRSRADLAIAIRPVSHFEMRLTCQADTDGINGVTFECFVADAAAVLRTIRAVSRARSASSESAYSAPFRNIARTATAFSTYACCTTSIGLPARMTGSAGIVAAARTTITSCAAACGLKFVEISFLTAARHQLQERHGSARRIEVGKPASPSARS